MEQQSPEGMQKYNRLVDPRQQDIEKTTCNLYEPALKEMGWKPPLYVLLYNQIRYYEDYGKLKVGYSVASKETLAEQFGVSEKEINKAFDNLTNKYRLGNWVICDQKIFRNVKKIWVSNVRQERGSMEDLEQLLLENRRKEQLFLKNRSGSPTLEDQNSSSVGIATPVVTGVESKYKVSEIYTNAYGFSSANADSSQSRSVAEADASAPASKEELSFPFDEEVVEKVSVRPTGKKDQPAERRAWAIANKLYQTAGYGKYKPGVKFRNRVKDRLAEGFTEDELVACVEWAKSDELYKSNDGGPMALLSEDALAKFLKNRENEEKIKAGRNDNPEFTPTWL